MILSKFFPAKRGRIDREIKIERAIEIVNEAATKGVVTEVLPEIEMIVDTMIVVTLLIEAEMIEKFQDFQIAMIGAVETEIVGTDLEKNNAPDLALLHIGSRLKLNSMEFITEKYQILWILVVLWSLMGLEGGKV